MNTPERSRDLTARLWNRIVADLWERPNNNLAPLDGMRGFASIIVVVYHCALFTQFLTAGSEPATRSPWVGRLVNGFWSGIDIFFVLSGFLIGRILVRDLERHGRLFFPSFFLRRAFRIFPAYYLVLTLALVFLAPLDEPLFRFLFHSADAPTLWRASWANYVYVVNYLDIRSYPTVMNWAWSLCVEEHFYLLLPLALYLTYRLPQRARLFVVVSFVFMPFLARLLRFAADPSSSLLDHYYYYSHFRFDEIFVGVLLGYLSVVHSERLSHWVRRFDAWLVPVALTAIGSVWIFGGLLSSNAFSIVFQFSIMASGSGLILLKSTLTNSRTTAVLSHPLWYPLARISYGTYLIHPYILFGLIKFWAGGQLARIGGVDFLILSTAVMTLSTIAAALMFVVLEAPLLRVGMRVSLSVRGQR